MIEVENTFSNISGKIVRISIFIKVNYTVLPHS